VGHPAGRIGSHPLKTAEGGAASFRITSRKIKSEGGPAPEIPVKIVRIANFRRGLVIAYNEAEGEISVVDRQLLLYRKYSTVKWPWEDLIAEPKTSKSLFDSTL
jgi:hypothetical protein